MAVTSMLQRILDNALTAKFAKSLDQNDLPEGWADNPEIVQLAEDAYSVMGTESPWFKSWFGKSKVVDKSKDPKHIYHGTVLYEPGLESPIVDPADILTAPFGVVGAGAKAAAMAAEPFISYGMDKAINGLFDLFSDEED